MSERTEKRYLITNGILEPSESICCWKPRIYWFSRSAVTSIFDSRKTHPNTETNIYSNPSFYYAVVKMAASIEISGTSSSESDNSDSEEDSSNSEEQELTSWAKIYKSLKLLSRASQQKDPRSHIIFHTANGAVLHFDFVNALKLFSLGLNHFYNECQESHQEYISIMGSDGLDKRIPFDKRMLRYALEGCLQDKDNLTSKQCRYKLTEILDRIFKFCDLMSLMDFTLLEAVASLYFCLKEKQKTFHLSARALQLNPKSLSLQEMFENICCHLVERWHFIMLNDYGRNYAYQQAIEAALSTIGRKAIVCDIGCGTGLLSLIACKQPNSGQVFAIEKSASMCDVAGHVFSANLDPVMAKKIVLVNMMSSQMSVPQDMPYRADILVTETFDAGLFGEGILPTLCHAWKHLLKNTGLEKGRVVPGRAQLFLQAVECNAILKESRFLGQLDSLNTSDIHICGMTGLCESEPYSALDLKHLRGGYRTLSEPLQFMNVDFNDPQELRRLNKGITQETAVGITSPGRLDAMVVWFSLHLVDSVVISTHTDRHCCWDQAVFPVQPVKVGMQPLSRGPLLDLNVQKGDQLRVQHEVAGARLCLEATAILRPDEDSLCCNPSVPKFLNDLEVWWGHSVYCLTAKEVKALNNTSWGCAQYKRLQELFTLVAEDNSVTDFIHLNDGFSPLCLQALRLGFDQSVISLDDQSHQALLHKMAALNDIDMRRLKLLEDVNDPQPSPLDDVNRSHDSTELSPVCQGATGERRTDEPPGICTSTERNAVIICDLIDAHGRLIEGLQYQQDALRNLLSSYRRKAVSPYTVDVFGMFVDSEHLLRLSRLLSDADTLGFNISSFINKYATRNHQDISLTALPHTKLSEPFKMFAIDISKLFGVTESADAPSSGQTSPPDQVPITKQDTAPIMSYPTEPEEGEHSASLPHPQTGRGGSLPELKPITDYSPKSKRRRLESVDDDEGYDAFPDYYLSPDDGELSQSVHLQIPIINPGHVTALIYWFELHLSPTCSISTADPAHHWHQAAVMTLPSQSQRVAVGSVLSVFCQISGSAISFMIE